MKVLFCALNTYGFIHPMIGLAKQLQSSGHEVGFVCDGSMSELLARQNLTRFACGRNDLESYRVQVFTSPARNLIQIKHLEYALASFDADVIVTSPLAFGPLIVAERQSIPLVVIGFLSYLWSTDQTESEVSKAMAEVYDWRTKDMLQHYNRTRTFVGLKELEQNNAKLPFAGDLFLQRSTPTTTYREAELPNNVRLVGPCLWEENPDNTEQNELETWLAQQQNKQRKVIYVSHGRTFQQPKFWSQLKSQFAAEQYLVVASTDRMECEIGEVPENFYVKRYIPQSQVLAHSDVVISNGNTTVTLGALKHGVPMLVIPGGAETPDNADLCQRLGVAINISCDEIQEQDLTAAVSSLLNEPSYSQNSRAISAEMNKYKDFELAEKLVSELVNKTDRPC